MAAWTSVVSRGDTFRHSALPALLAGSEQDEMTLRGRGGGVGTGDGVAVGTGAGCAGDDPPPHATSTEAKRTHNPPTRRAFDIKTSFDKDGRAGPPGSKQPAGR